MLGGRERYLPGQRLAVFWGGIPHQVIDCEATECWIARVPLAWLLRRSLPPAFAGNLLGGSVYFEPDVDHFECDLYRMRLWTRDAASRQRLLAQAAALELEGRLFRLASAQPKTLPTLPNIASNNERRPRSLQLAELIARHHAVRFSMSDLAGIVGLHRNYVMNLFRRELGTTLLEYLTQHRLARAMQSLIATDQNIESVALRSGFGSRNRLDVTFRRALKESPASFRRRHCSIPTSNGG